MSIRGHWRTFITGLLEWPAVDKALLLPLILLPLYCQYLAWAAYVLWREDRTQLVDVVYLVGQGRVFAA